MAWFADLDRCSYFGARFASCLRAVGWLERGHEFATGQVDSAFAQRLGDLLKSPWAPIAFAGPHTCDLSENERPVRGANNLFVPGDRVIYVCPELIVHYISVHGYAPPVEFCSAVVSCPTMNSPEYFRRLSENADRDFGSMIDVSRSMDGH
jgi:hypothetical protein